MDAGEPLDDGPQTPDTGLWTSMVSIHSMLSHSIDCTEKLHISLIKGDKVMLSRSLGPQEYTLWSR